MDKALEKGRLYSDRLGVKLTPRAFNEGQVVPVTPMMARGMALANSYSKAALAGPESRERAWSDTEEPPTSFGELIYRAQVTVEYAVEAK